jgi:hypothetical protein
MTRCLVWLCVLSSGCRYVVAPTPSVSPNNPALLSGTASADPQRQPAQLPANRCGFACGPAHHCDERLAQCVPDATRASDAGVSWLPSGTGP